ncbi:MAG TPA: hypothetical protein VF592_09750 [Sphingomonas sp.]|jgi:hypothetical protein|uniref:hypothetical protein n=1 Tax=Sphingomonas sp. TaxID=28214 RepID=UPI002ED917BA
MTQDAKNEQAQTPPVIRLAAAEVDAVAARDRLNDTVARLQSKLDPKLLAKEAVGEVKLLGRQAVGEAKVAGDKGVVYARDNPRIVAGTAAGIILFLLRRPILGLFKRRPGLKPQKAAKPMTQTAANDRLARTPHPTQGVGRTSIRPLATPHPTMTPQTAPKAPAAPVTASNEGIPLEGQTL